jgi:hypothetical protein
MSSIESVRKHEQALKRAGFKHVRATVHPDLLEALRNRRRPGESVGQVIERLILGASRHRPRVRK